MIREKSIHYNGTKLKISVLQSHHILSVPKWVYEKSMQNKWDKTEDVSAADSL